MNVYGKRGSISLLPGASHGWYVCIVHVIHVVHVVVVFLWVFGFLFCTLCTCVFLWGWFLLTCVLLKKVMHKVDQKQNEVKTDRCGTRVRVFATCGIDMQVWIGSGSRRLEMGSHDVGSKSCEREIVG